MTTGKRLFVLRHAKSSWGDPVLEDHDRPLAPRGRKAAKLLAAHVRLTEIEPALILCSASRRTRETLQCVLPDREALIEDELYNASGKELIARLQRVPGELTSVMVIGHSPAVQMLVLKLAGAEGRGDGARRADSALRQVERKFPTGALATLAFDRDWAELAPGCARLIDYVRPRALV
ncbi:MAG: histidine phosphatase family protein [Actinomycetota bacterium]|nr:histidine phosphatase family protein [Actinomycetota bacterium]